MVDDFVARFGIGVGMQFDSAEGSGQSLHRITLAVRIMSPGAQQAFEGWLQKIAFPQGGLQQPHPMQRSVRLIAHQIENELDNLSSCIDGAALLDVGRREFGNGRRDRTLSR